MSETEMTLVNWPFGLVQIWYGLEDQIPTGWLVCHGQELARADYEDLYTHFQQVNPSLIIDEHRFEMPDFGAKFLIGSNSDNDSFQLGQTGGKAKHKLSVAEMPSHSHGYSRSKYVKRARGDKGAAQFGVQKATAKEGGNKAHNNMPPYHTVHYIMFSG